MKHNRTRVNLKGVVSTMGKDKGQENFLMNKGNPEIPLFDASDGQYLSFDMFRGPQLGFFSDLDLSKPEQQYNEIEKLKE